MCRGFLDNELGSGLRMRVQIVCRDKLLWRKDPNSFVPPKMRTPMERFRQGFLEWCAGTRDHRDVPASGKAQEHSGNPGPQRRVGMHSGDALNLQLGRCGD